MINSLDQAEQLFESNENVPPGYVKIQLSTGGKIKGRAPKELFIRNFSVEETMQLGGLDKKDIPIKVPEMIDNLIWDEGVSIKDFLEVEATELMARFYASFYQTTLSNIPYEVTDTDKKWVLENVYDNNKEGPYQRWLQDLQNGSIKPAFDIDLTSLTFYEVPDGITGRVKWERNGFTAEFQLPKFGDAAIIQMAIQNEFGDRDKRYSQLYQNYQKNQELDMARRRGEVIDSGAYTYISENELKDIRKYELEKTAYSLELLKGLYLVSVNGEDISNKKLSERVEIAKNEPRIDYCCFQTVSEYFQNIQLGIKPEVRTTHPIKGSLEVIKYPFRALEILTFIRNYRPSGCNLTIV